MSQKITKDANIDPSILYRRSINSNVSDLHAIMSPDQSPANKLKVLKEHCDDEKAEMEYFLGEL